MDDVRHIQLAELRLLVETGAVTSAQLEATGRGLALRAATRQGGEVILKSKAGGVRIFVDPRAAFNTLSRLGINKASLNLGAWIPTAEAV